MYRRPLLQRLDLPSVVVFRARQLGAMLCAVPALRALRAALPRTHIALVGLPWARQFADRFDAYIDEFIAFPGHPLLSEQPMQPTQPMRQDALAHFYTSVCLRQFALAVQLHGSGDVANDIVGGFGTQAMAGFCRGAPVIRNGTVLFPCPDVGTEPERLLSLMAQLGAPSAGAHLEFPLSHDDEDAWRDSGLGDTLVPGEYLCIHPGARRRGARWPAHLFAQVGDRLASEFGLQVVLTGSADEADLTADVANRMRHTPLDATAALSIGTLGVLLRDAKLLLCNDTDVSHIAAGLGLKSIVVFGTADIARWAPLDRHTHRCIWDPAAERAHVVLQHARALLSGTAPSRQRSVGMWPYW
jgi:ADP-heptose:LPS heptosyltransferase